MPFPTTFPGEASRKLLSKITGGAVSNWEAGEAAYDVLGYGCHVLSGNPNPIGAPCPAGEPLPAARPCPDPDNEPLAAGLRDAITCCEGGATGAADTGFWLSLVPLLLAFLEKLLTR